MKVMKMVKMVMMVMVVTVMTSVTASAYQIGYLKQTIKSPRNLICIYKVNDSFYAVNMGRKAFCPTTYSFNKGW